jgi:hypothetical protein
MPRTATKKATAKPSNVFALKSDPIFAAISNHKLAYIEHDAAVGWRNVLEEELPSERRKSSVTAFERKIVKEDDPRWIAAERRVSKAGNAMDDAAVAILAIKPGTLAGVVALLKYVTSHIDGGSSWPDSFQSVAVRESLGHDWMYGLLKMLASALPKLAIKG